MPLLGLVVTQLAPGSVARQSSRANQALMTPAPVISPVSLLAQGVQTRDGLRFADVAAGQRALTQAASLSEAEAALDAFFAFYGMDVAISVVDGSEYIHLYCDWKILGAADLPSLRRYGSILLDEWGKYPRAWITVTGVKRVALVKGLTNQGDAVAGAPDPVGDVVYLDVTYDASGEGYERNVIHHEFNHLLEFNLFGSYNRTDPEWEALNPVGFRYLGSGADAYHDHDYTPVEHPQPGFVDTYATYAIEEDKAEVYAHLFTRDGSARLTQWMATDASLRGKVAAYHQIIQEQVPSMDEAYFRAINPF